MICTRPPFSSLLLTALLTAGATSLLPGCVEVVSSGSPEDAAEPGDSDAAEADGGEEDASNPDEPDAGQDAGRDGGRDGGRDARVDAQLDATDDGSMDATLDAAPDATAEAGPEAGPDADAQPDAAPEAGTCPQCPGGRCLEDNTTCVECSAAWPCADSTLKCDLSSHTCKACLPSADECPDGKYCAPDFTCVQGCKGDSSCGSGDCNASRECVSCLDDDECGAGRVCGTFECGAACTSSGDCGSGRECCSGSCIDTKRDIEHCGGCGVSCTAEQFCGASGCAEVAVSKLCDTAAITVVVSGASSDVTESQLLSATLSSQCASVQVSSVMQDAASVINNTNGRPLAGGNNTLVTLGSAYSNKLTNYMETQGIAPVYMTVLLEENPQVFEFRRRRNGALILREPVAGETASHAHFLVQTVRDPASGSLVVLAYGYWAEGTAAARWFLGEEVLPSLASFDDGWYLYEWDDAGAPGLDAGDVFSLLGSGD
ncbi:MAG TPA: hypothetical protein VFZ61_01790 [Polyangiales bacterium]